MSRSLVRRLMLVLLLMSLVLPGVVPVRAGPPAQDGIDPASPLADLAAAMLADRQPVQEMAALSATPCVGGLAGAYPCDGVDLMAFMPLASIGGGNGNDVWGWTDPLTGREYALTGRSTGTAFVDVTDPQNPVYLGNLPSHTSASIWRDIKVYADHAFIVSEASGHGMQVFDLTQLRNVPAPPVTFAETAHYNGFGNAHNIVINDGTGYAYAVGTGTCSGSLHMVNIQNPVGPAGAGCAGSAYTHDAHCVTYSGPDPDHQGKEICFNANGTTSGGGHLAIVDVTDKASPVTLAAQGYAGSGYAHQGWLAADQATFFLGDELDEQTYGHNTKTYVWDVSDLDNPVVATTYLGTVAAIDHNMYEVGDRLYQANYRAGLRILDSGNPLTLSEVGFFDIYPSSNSPSFNGAWSVYPFFASGTILVSGIEQGLFLLRAASGCFWADLDCDCSVDAVDVGIAAGAWGCEDGDACYDGTIDLDSSGRIEMSDVMSFAGQWGWTCTS